MEVSVYRAVKTGKLKLFFIGKAGKLMPSQFFNRLYFTRLRVGNMD